MAKVIQLFDAPDSSTGIPSNQLIAPAAGKTIADTTSTQTLTGKTMSGAVQTNCAINAAVLAALGTNFANSAPIVTAYPAIIHATGADATVGISLPVAVAGAWYTIKNSDAANAILKVYPQTNTSINSTANSALSMAANTMATFYAISNTAWVTAKTPA